MFFWKTWGGIFLRFHNLHNMVNVKSPIKVTQRDWEKNLRDRYNSGIMFLGNTKKLACFSALSSGREPVMGIFSAFGEDGF